MAKIQERIKEMNKNSLLLEEYKILENRYRTDVARIWSQAQILIAANLLVVTALGSLFTTGANKERLIDPRFVVTAVSIIGVAVSLVWFLSVATDYAFNQVSWRLLESMERELDLPIKVFTQAGAERHNFKPWASVGGARALKCLSLFFAAMWCLIGFGIWKLAAQ